MEQRTEEQGVGLSGMLMRLIVALVVMGALFISLHPFAPPKDDTVRSNPWMSAAGITIQNGLDLFGGKEPQGVTREDRHVMLVTLLLALVIGPTMLMFSWRRLATTSVEDSVGMANVGFFLGAVVTSFSMLMTLAGAVLHPQTAASMRDAQALGRHRDQAIEGIYRVTIDAHLYTIIPRVAGGGGGSYTDYRIPEALRSDSDADYEVTEVSDTLITIMGKSRKYEGSVVAGTFGAKGWMRPGGFQFAGSFQ